MFNGNLGFNPFDKNNNVHANNAASRRHSFLASFGQPNIYCYNGDPRKKISSMAHTSDLRIAVDSNINNSSDVYFYVNGGRKIYAINTIKACFVDMDAGRDDQGSYLKAKDVQEKKKGFLQTINNFSVRPSWVIDTRNGYQVYWILDSQSQQMVNKTTWDGLQKKLVNYFDGDARAIKINQIYRVPYTWWRKGWEKKQPYFTSILEGSTGSPVNIKNLIEALTGQPATVNIIPNNTSDAWFAKWNQTYKKSDITGVPVSVSAATDILNAINSMPNQKTVCRYTASEDCGQKNTLNSAWASYNTDKNYNDTTQKTYGESVPVYPSQPPASSSDTGLVLTGEQAKLLKTVVEYLNQASTALYFSNNRFLSGAARDLANQISDKFCVG